MQQAIASMRAELDATRAQLVTVSGNYDNLAAAHRQLEQDTTAVVQAMATANAEAQTRLKELEQRGGGKTEKMDLLNLKTVQPAQFTAKEGEPWKPWAKKTKLYLNGKAQGFRAALRWAEAQTDEITDLAGLSWNLKETANVQLHEFLLSQTQGRALQIAEEPDMDERGFEAWRRMRAEFEPKGGLWEAKATGALIHPPAAKDLCAMH